MKSWLTFFRSLFSLGQLGWILLLMALAILIGCFTALGNFDNFDIAWARIDALSALEDTVSVHLREMELNELYYVFALEYGTETSSELQSIDEHYTEINQTLDDLAAEGHFTTDLDYYEEDIALLADFRSLLDDHQQTFSQVVQAYTSGDAESAQALMDVSEEENAELQEMLKELGIRLNADLNDAAQTFPQDVSFAIRGISIAVIGMMILVLLGYRAIGRLTLPLLDLTNAVTAAGGDHYNNELLARSLHLGGPPGRFARLLDAFARAIEQRDAGLKAEMVKLREQLYESRRRRLKIARPNQASGEPQ